MTTARYLLPQLQGASARDPAALGLIGNVETVSWSAPEQLQPKYMSHISLPRQLQQMDHAGAHPPSAPSSALGSGVPQDAMGHLPQQTLISQS